MSAFLSDIAGAFSDWAISVEPGTFWMQEYRKKRAKLAIPNDQKERRILLELEFNVDESVGLIKNFILAPAGYPFPIVGEERNHKPHALAGSPPLKIHHNTNPNSVKIKQKTPAQPGQILIRTNAQPETLIR